MNFRKVKNKIFNNKIFKNKYVMIPSYIFVGIMILNFLFLIVTKESIFSWAFRKLAGYTEEIKSVEITSSGYNSTPGSVKLTKSAEWTGRGEVTVTLDLDTVGIERDVPENVIILLDISTSYGGEHGNSCGNVCTYVEELAEAVLAHDGSHVSFITFATDAQILVEHSTNSSDINTASGLITIGGATNYYKAFKKASEILSRNYDRNIETHIVLITDGGATDGIGNDYEEYAFIKRTYPGVIVDGIQYTELKQLENQDVERISDRQYYVNDDEIRNKIFDAGLSTEYYENFLVQEDFDSTYFTIDNSSITRKYGSVRVDNSGGNEVLNWNLVDGRFKSGYRTSLTFKLKLKSAYMDLQGFVPVSNNVNITASANNMTALNFSSNLTPVLKTFFKVTYSANAPTGCINNYNSTENHFPFENVVKNVENLVCPGFLFKGFEVGDDSVQLMGSDYFVMPGYDVDVNAIWTNLSISKSFEGELTERATLYRFLSTKAETKSFEGGSGGFYIYSASSDSNGKGLYKVKSTEGDTNPILVYRGDVSDNNVLFADFCWKIVRTTETGGVKMIYNGKPVGNSCTATGTATSISDASNWTYVDSSNSNDLQSVASTLGYMYGTEYPTKTLHPSSDKWYEFVGLTEYYHSDSATLWNSNIYVGNSIVYTSGNGWTGFKVSNPVGTYLGSNANVVGKYTIFAADDNHYAYTYGSYITRLEYEKNRIYFVHFDLSQYNEAAANGFSGRPYDYFLDKAKKTTWSFGSDVTYNGSQYTLTNVKSIHPYYFWDEIGNIQNDGVARHYTCLGNGTTTCSKVAYVFSYLEEYGVVTYIELSGGKEINVAFDEMVTNSSNTSNSKVKATIDSWYANNMTPYTYMLEDAIWCNDRSGDFTSTTWNKSTLFEENNWHLGFNSSYSTDFNTCRTVDSFTVSTANGNGKLTYPVGLITKQEANFAGLVGSENLSNYLVSGYDYWTMSPNNFNNIVGYPNIVKSNGAVGSHYLNGRSANQELLIQNRIRPMISLKPGVYISGGTGTKTDPYTVEE